ncbi:MAG: autotransporter-associated beta strand repeat-containing protein [Luteolibacter sp.]
MKPKFNSHRGLQLSAIIIAAAGLSSFASAQSTWSGLGADANWSTAANWDVAIADNFNTALTFDGSTQPANSNNLTGGTATSLTFAATAGAFTLRGNAITLAGNITISSINLQTVNLPIDTTAVRTVTLTTGGGNVTLGGIVSGTNGGVTTAGAGTLTLNGANSFMGATTIGAGTTIKDGNVSGLGVTTGALTLSGGTLDLNGNSLTKAGLTASAAGSVVNSASAATLSVNGGSNLSGLTVTNSSSIMINGGNALTTAAAALITGSGSFGLQNQTGTLRNNNLAANLGTDGDLVFNGTGKLQTINIAGNATAFTGTVTVNATTDSGPLFFNLGNATNIGLGLGNVILTSSATKFAYLQYNGGGSVPVPVGALTGTTFSVVRNTTNASTATWRIGANGTDTTFAGAIIDNGTALSGLEKTGSAILTFSGANTDTGATTVSQGTLKVTGSLGATAVTVADGTTLLLAGGSPSSLSVAKNATFSMANNAIAGINVGGVAGVTFGGPSAGEKSLVTLEVGASNSDSISIANNLAVNAGGVDITIADLGIAAGQVYPLMNFTAGTGTGFATGSGTTVGAIKLTNPNIGFGVTGSLLVDGNSVNLVSSGSAAPSAAYWSGSAPA